MNTVRRWAFAAAALAGALLPLLGAAEPERRLVWGEVLRVEPLVEAVDAYPAACFAAKPASFADLVAWDLAIGCAKPRAPRVERYRVDYRWNGREYSYVSTRHPGKRVALHVEVEARTGR